MNGVLQIGFIAQVMISLTRNFVEPVKRMSTKFIIASMQKLTLTLVSAGNGVKKKIFSNFNPINKAILAEYLPEDLENRPKTGDFDEVTTPQNLLSNSKTS